LLRNDPETRGGERFAAGCSSCHRLGEIAPPPGKATAPDLTGFGDKFWVLGMLQHPDSDMHFGKTAFKGMMPSMVEPPADPEAAKAFTPMSPTDQESVAVFLVAQAKGEKAAGLPGEKIVASRCTSCHRLDGKTDDEESLAPELRGWASPAWIEAQIKNPGSGATYPKGVMADDLKGHMPAFADKLSEKDIKLLARWVHDRVWVPRAVVY
jgi:ubiquinol-cytochrome c reductase cytochrome b subunit